MGQPWRQYNGNTTPLLEAFLTPITVSAGSSTVQYNATLQTVGITDYGAQAALTFGNPVVNGASVNAGSYATTYGGGLYSNQLGYDFIPATSRAPSTLPAPR